MGSKVIEIEQTLAAKYHAAKATFDDGWKLGAYDWLQANAVGFMITIMLSEQQFEAAWQRVRDGKAPVPEFDAALEKWRQAHVDALKEFKTRSGR